MKDEDERRPFPSWLGICAAAVALLAFGSVASAQQEEREPEASSVSNEDRNPLRLLDDGFRFLEARVAVEDGRLDDAEAALLPMAERGDRDAKRVLAQIYLYGYVYAGPEYQPRYSEALDLLEPLAETGDIDAAYAVGFMYAYGVGTPRDSEQAELWIGHLRGAGDPMSLNNAAYIYALDGHNLEEALSLVREALAVEPESGLFLGTFGWVLYRMGRYVEALPPLCRAAQLLPQHPEIRYHLGDAYWRLGDIESAEHQWRLGLDLFDDGAVRVDPEYRGVLDSEIGAETLRGLVTRLADGLPDAPSPTVSAEDGKDIEARYRDECQIPTA